MGIMTVHDVQWLADCGAECNMVSLIIVEYKLRQGFVKISQAYFIEKDVC